jgi:nucleoside-diphosphate-sugar epimerase
MRVLVTGPNGLIGSHLVPELLARGHEVTGLGLTGRTPAVDHPAYEFVKGDALDVDALTGLATGQDALIGCASLIGGIRFFHQRPYDLASTNLRLAAALNDAAIAAHHFHPLRRVVCLSSSIVYDRAEGEICTEGDELHLPPPLSAYGVHKLATEAMTRAAWDQYEIPYTIVRPFNCVGAGERLSSAHALPDLARKVLAGQDPLHILGDGSQVRYYTHGADLARGIATATESRAGRNEDFNLSTPVGTSVLELAALIWRKVRGYAPLRVVSDRPFKHDPPARVPDVSKARELLGFEASIPLERAVDEVLAWLAATGFRGELAAPGARG